MWFSSFIYVCDAQGLLREVVLAAVIGVGPVATAFKYSIFFSTAFKHVYSHIGHSVALECKLMGNEVGKEEFEMGDALLIVILTVGIVYNMTNNIFSRIRIF